MSDRRLCRALTAVAAAVLCALTAACSGLPTSSRPDVIKAIEPAGAPVTTAPPPPSNADPRAIVSYFLDSNAKIDEDAAKSVLTSKTRTNWSDTPVVVLDRLQVANPVFVGRSRDVSRVTVSGNQIGSVDGNGTYTPVLSPDAGYTYAFQLDKVAVPGSSTKQWRIDRVPKGVLISEDEFSAYRQRFLYFFDANNSHFIPDVRYSPLLDPGALAQWLVAQLVAEQANQALGSAFPPTATTANVEVIPPAASSPPNTPMRIEVPTARQLPQDSINAMAAQIGATLSQVQSITALEITDNGRAVRVPAVSGTVFAPATPNLVGRYEQASPNPTLFYVHAGGVYSARGVRLPITGLTRTETGGASITSVALRDLASSRGYDVAAVYDDKQNRRFGVGTQGRLRYVPAVRGRLTQPSWQPGSDFVWIAAGSKIWRVSSGGVAQTVSYEFPGGTANITAIRVSPDGGRIAAVIGPADNKQIWEGTIATGQSGQGGGAAIKNFQPITPKGINVQDAGWYGLDRLFFVGEQLGTFVFASVQCDGSALTTNRSTDNLPGAPDSLAITYKSLAVVSTGGTLWKQTGNGASWTRVRSVEQENNGINPTYVQ